MALALLCAPALLAFDAPAAPCEVLLNEFLAAPTTDWNQDAVISSRDDEWVELVNAGSVAVDLSSFALSDRDTTIRIRLSGMLAAGAHLVVFGSDAVQWQRDNDRGVSGLSLNNAGDTLRLLELAGTDTTQIDSYGYKSHEGTAERSVGRYPDGNGWELFDGLNPYTGGLDPQGNGCMPTPGTSNECEPTQTHSSTWGRVKSAFR